MATLSSSPAEANASNCQDVEARTGRLVTRTRLSGWLHFARQGVRYALDKQALRAAS